jgi:hypothetical protein
MKRYSSAQARTRLSALLDDAEAGTPAVIERRGVRFRLVRETNPAKARRRTALIEIIDPAVASGDWTWSLTRRGLTFRSRTHRKRGS